MLSNAAPEARQILGSIPALVLMICLSPVFFLLALLYVCNHPNRADGAIEEISLINLVVTN